MIQGVYDLAMSMLVDVLFAKCMCVDAASKGANFQQYAMDNCSYFAPTHMKPTILGLIMSSDLRRIHGAKGYAGNGSQTCSLHAAHACI